MLSNQSTDLTELLCDFPAVIVAITLKNNLRVFFFSPPCMWILHKYVIRQFGGYSWQRRSPLLSINPQAKIEWRTASGYGLWGDDACFTLFCGIIF